MKKVLRIKTLIPEIHINILCKFSTYLTVNTLCLHRTDEIPIDIGT
jgi:hypothetical protein